MKKYDTLIIGSGLGGLACAAILSKEGQRVCVLEKNEQLGGNLQTFRRNGKTFDTGVHYLSGLERGQNLYRFFNYLGLMERLDLVKMDESGFDAVMFGDDEKTYLYGMGYERFATQLIADFPEEKSAILHYCSDMQAICQNFPMYNLRSENSYKDKSFFEKSAKEYFEELTQNETLRAVLAGTNLLYAGDGARTPVYVHALVVNSYIESSWRCAKGGDQLAKSLAKIIRANGGDIFRKSEVKKIHVAAGRAEYVETAKGECFYADNFVSNLHPAQTLSLTDTPLFRKAYRQRISELKNSVSAFEIYLVLKPGTLKYTNRNYYFFADKNAVWNAVSYDEKTWGNHFAIFEAVPKQGEFTEVMTIMTYMRFEDVARWMNTVNTTLLSSSREPDYELFKKQKAEQLLETVYKKFPELKDAIDCYYTSTPLSFRDYIGNGDGNMYGIAKDFNDPLKTVISPVTKVPNLYFTGANIVLHGILGVTVSAFITSFFLLGKEYMLQRIAEAE